MKGKRVLVTGGAGFIGSHLVDRLLVEGFEVSVLDNLSTGRINNLSLEKKFSFVKGDILDEEAVKKAVKDADAVYHLAAITSVPYSVKHPEITRRVNVEGTRRLVVACLRSSVERFIYISSCAVYGEPQYLPVDEKHPAKPISPYAETKLEAEELCLQFQERFGLKTTIIRPFNVYGPRMRGGQYGGVIASFLERLLAGEPPIVYGDGFQTRDFVHVLDVVEALTSALKRRDAVGEVFNVASGSATSIEELAELMVKLIGVNGVMPLHQPMREGDVRHSYADIGKARVKLAYEPKISLKEGLLTLIRAHLQR